MSQELQPATQLASPDNEIPAEIECRSIGSAGCALEQQCDPCSAASTTVGVEEVEDPVEVQDDCEAGTAVTLHTSRDDTLSYTISASNPLAMEVANTAVNVSLEDDRKVSLDSKVEEAKVNSPTKDAPAEVKTKPQRDRLWTMAISCIIATIPALVMGCTVGFPSVALFDLRALPPEYELSTVLLDLFTAIAPIGAVFGGLPAGWVADKWGRKAALMLNGLPLLIGYLMIMYARFAVTRAGFIAVLLLGRFITGFGGGMSVLAVTIYNAEMASTRVRGVFSSLGRLYSAIGLLVVYGVGSIPGFHYYDTALVIVGIIAVFEVMMVMLYETPRWLITQGQKERASKTLVFLRGSKYDFEKELADIITTVKKTKRMTAVQVLKQFKRRSVIAPLVVLLVMLFFIETSGLNAITAFGAIIFNEAGVANPNSVSAYSIGLISVVFTFFSIFIIDLVGRKILLTICGIGIFLSNSLLGVHQFITRPSLCHNTTILMQDIEMPCNTQFTPLAIFSVCLFSAMFAVGWGPVAWVLLGELLPLQVRGMASGIAVIVVWGTVAVVTGCYLSYVELVSPWFAWWTFSVFNLAAVSFAIFGLVETKGKSLEEIQEYFESKHSRKSKVSDLR